MAGGGEGGAAKQPPRAWTDAAPTAALNSRREMDRMEESGFTSVWNSRRGECLIIILTYNLPQNIAVSVLTTKNAKSTKNVSNITNFSVFFAFFVVKIGFHLTLSQCFFAAKPRGWLSPFFYDKARDKGRRSRCFQPPNASKPFRTGSN
jgi:hypothetical protein